MNLIRVLFVTSGFIFGIVLVLILGFIFGWFEVDSELAYIVIILAIGIAAFVTIISERLNK